MFHVSSQNASRLADVPADGAPGAGSREPGAGTRGGTDVQKAPNSHTSPLLPPPPQLKQWRTKKKKDVTPLIPLSLVELGCVSPAAVAAAAASLNLPSPTALWSRLLSHTATSISRSVCIAASGLPSVCEMRCGDQSEGAAQQRSEATRCWKHFRKQTQSQQMQQRGCFTCRTSGEDGFYSP